MQAGVVKKIPLISPHLFVHVFPLSAWINVNLHRVQLEWAALARLRWPVRRLFRRPDRPLVLFGIQHLLAVKRNDKAAHAIENLLCLAGLEIKLVNFRRRAAIFKIDGIDRWPLGKKEHASLAACKSVIIPRWNRQG